MRRGISLPQSSPGQCNSAPEQFRRLQGLVGLSWTRLCHRHTSLTRSGSISTSNTRRENITLIPQLNLTDTGTKVLWLDSSTVFSKYKVDDPWFASNTPSHPADLGYDTVPGN